MKFTMGFRSLMATALLFGITEGVFRNEIQVSAAFTIPVDRDVESKEISESESVVSPIGSRIPVISTLMEE
jgi:hypothetical protein